MLADSAALLEINGTFYVEVLAFLVMIAVLGKWAYPWIMQKAEERQNQIESALKQAEQARQDAQTARESVQKQLDESREQAREILNRAHRDAVVEVEELRAKARDEAKAASERAQNEIAAEKERAMRELRKETGALVVAAAGKVLGQAIDEKVDQRLIEESLRAVEKN